MIVCKYCGSHNIKTYSDSGNPFDRHPEVTVCGDCGRLLSSEFDIMDTMYAEALKQCSEEELAECTLYGKFTMFTVSVAGDWKVTFTLPNKE